MKTMKRAPLQFSNFCAIRLHTSHTSDKIVSEGSSKQFKRRLKIAQDLAEGK